MKEFNTEVNNYIVKVIKNEKGSITDLEEEPVITVEATQPMDVTITWNQGKNTKVVSAIV